MVLDILPRTTAQHLSKATLWSLWVWVWEKCGLPTCLGHPNHEDAVHKCCDIHVTHKYYDGRWLGINSFVVTSGQLFRDNRTNWPALRFKPTFDWHQPIRYNLPQIRCIGITQSACFCNGQMPMPGQLMRTGLIRKSTESETNYLSLRLNHQNKSTCSRNHWLRFCTGTSQVMDTLHENIKSVENSITFPHALVDTPVHGLE